MDDRDRQPESDVAREQLHAIDRLCTEYDRHWRRWQQGEEQLRPRIEDYLAQAPEDIRCRVLIDLIAQDYDLRSAAGEVVDVADYRQRFPAYGQWVEEALKQRAAAMPHPAGASASLADTTDASHLKSPREDAGTTGLPDHFGRYVVRELIGKGGFGAVYLAHDPDLKRLVAVKVPRLGPDGTLHGSIEQFIHEAQTAASLRHPGIVAIHDVLRGADHVAIVQEYIAGQDLRHWMHGRRCEPVKAAEIILKVVETLTFAHSQGFIHRDLKPGNILLDDGDCVHLADFGLAVHAGELGQRGATSGTPAYMSPEQVRGETHRLDGRSDIWSVGVILYELLTSSRPFRGETADELYTAIVRDDPWPPRQIRPDVPAELDRICIKCLAKRASDRFASAADLADDLRIGLETGFADRSRTRRDEEPRPAREAAAIVPKGLRPFGREDADFFLDLLPGPRDRTGLPDSVRFWKTRIEAPRAEESFPVGILYGPSGCGKSSLVMAGLLPCLSSRVATVYLDATHADTEAHVRRAIGETVPHAPRNVNLTRLLLELREGRHLAADQKLLIVLDQFEQWLHAHPAENGCELRDALRQCDGARVQAMLLVRDDFWLATSRFMQSVEVPVREGTNARAVDLFDSLHARKLLLTFGRAHGRLPEREDELSADQREFVRLAVEGLLEDDKVVCVRLALLVDMFKGREWTPANLKHVGGISGLGVTFLEELFDAASASQRHRVHREAAARVLQALLPEPGSTLKGRLRSRAELLAMSGYEHRPPDFDQLMLMLDRELRLVTPAAREDGSTAGEHTFYQLTHDYLVAPLRQWVHRRTKATRAGRAALSLAEREAEWTVRRETRRLPGFWEFVRIAAFTRHRDWTANQRAMMRRAALHHVTRLAVVAAVLAAAAWGLHAHQVSRSSEVNAIVQALATADTSEVPRLLEQLEPLRRRAHPLLMKLLSESPPGSRQRLHASLALLPFDGFQMEYLLTCIGAATPAEAQVLGEQSAPFASRLRTDILQRLEVALANGDGLLPLAVFSSATPVKPDWDRIAPAVVKQLVSLDVRAVDGWANALRPARTHLRPALEAVYRDATNGYSDQQRAIAAEILVEYLEGDFEPLANLLLDASASQFKVVYPAVERQPDALADYLASRTEGEPPRVWNDLPLDARWPAVTAKIAAEVESADGMVHERFAMCQTMAIERCLDVSEQLRASGYRPIRFRPYARGNTVQVAAIWTRDGLRWHLECGLTRDAMLQRDEMMRAEDLLVDDIAGYLVEEDGASRNVYSAVWVERGDGEGESMPVVGLAAPDYPDAQNELNRRGFVNRHTVHSCVGGDGVKRCSGIQRNYGGALSQNAFRITAEDFAGANIVFSALHFCLTDVAVTFTGESSYDAIWQAIPGFETEVMTELTTQLHLQRCRDLAEQGFRPAAISVAEGDAEGRLIAASGWRRPKVALDVKESLVKREANRAAILLRLGSPDLCSQLLKGSPDPRIRARLMCRLPEIVPCSALEQQLERETDVSSRRAIVLALGGYPAQQMPAGDRERLATVLLDWYRNDPDPGIHGACEWLLERWNLRDRLEEETKMLATGQLEGDRQWYVTGSGQSMILLGPVTKRFLTGSPPSEPGHELDQTPRLQFIPRRFAIAAKETTVAEFQAFCGECPQIDGHYTRNLAPQPTCPQISVSWYQAAVYCRWLSEKEGIAEEQMCYPPLDQIKEGMTMPADYLRRTGYRLPTEAEWEYACRANTVTARYFGESTDLMGEFAWSAEHADGRCHPVGSLKPNDFGVFDMLGNVWEWCQNRYDNNWTVHSEDPEDLTPLDDAVQRSRRGGAYSHGALSARAACRDAALPNSRVNTVGFRVARTMP